MWLVFLLDVIFSFVGFLGEFDICWFGIFKKINLNYNVKINLKFNKLNLNFLYENNYFIGVDIFWLYIEIF